MTGNTLENELEEFLENISKEKEEFKELDEIIEMFDCTKDMTEEEEDVSGSPLSKHDRSLNRDA